MIDDYCDDNGRDHRQSSRADAMKRLAQLRKKPPPVLVDSVPHEDPQLENAQVSTSSVDEVADTSAPQSGKPLHVWARERQANWKKTAL